MSKQIGSQFRCTLEEEGYTLIAKLDKTGEIIVKSNTTGILELYFPNDDHSGFTLEVDGMGYEFCRSFKADEQWYIDLLIARGGF